MMVVERLNAESLKQRQGQSRGQPQTAIIVDLTRSEVRRMICLSFDNISLAGLLIVQFLNSEILHPVNPI
jgi:hypothetical protein